MEKDIKVIAVIPARGGSKGLPDKNLKKIGDRTLVEWAIDAAKKSGRFDEIILSTDSEEIGAVGLKNQITFDRRPPELSEDRSLVIDTIRELWERRFSTDSYETIFLLLEPTSPFRQDAWIHTTIERLASEGFDSVATFEELEISPDRIWRIAGNEPTPLLDESDPFQPRQALSKAYRLNGAVYGFYPKRIPRAFTSTIFGNFYPLITERGLTIDIDTERDLALANAIYEYGIIKYT